MLYDNARDAHQYLGNTVCYWDGRPMYVERIGATFLASGYLLPITVASERVEVDINDARFNCRAFKLGYMNSERLGCAVYVARRPVRGVSQGLCENNLSFTIGGNDGRGRVLSMNNAIRDKGFADMLTGTYPTRQQATDRLGKDGTPSVAVTPWVAIKKHDTLTNLRFLEYRGREISFSETLEFVLPTEFEYLRQICAPSGVLRAA